MTNVLLITVIGMGLVFVVILMLWAMMELLVRALANKKPADQVIEGNPSTGPVEVMAISTKGRQKAAAAAAVIAAIQIRKRQAAVEAVRQALASQNRNFAASGETPPTSNWQAVMRAVQRQNRQKLFSRTPGAYGKIRGETK